MSELSNCREFYSLSLPPAERLFQKKRSRLDLLDDHIHAGVNFFATSQEISREWQLMAIVRLSGEKTKISEEAEQERAAHQKREQGYIQRIAKLEKFAEEKVAEVKASEILVEEVAADCKWLLARAVPLVIFVMVVCFFVGYCRFPHICVLL
ncbi:hypothetical protein Hanom_Chr11g01024311 [Helianthus anomalus]